MNQPVNPDGPNDRARDQGRRFLEDPLTRFDARVLDPSTAVRLTTGEAPSATVYVGDTLLVTASDRDDAEELLELLLKAVELSGLPLRWLERNPFRPSDDPDHDRRARLLTLAAELKLPLVFPVRFLGRVRRSPHRQSTSGRCCRRSGRPPSMTKTCAC